MKAKTASSRAPAVRNWKKLYTKMKNERDLLQQELVGVRRERDQYLKALYALTRESVDFDKKALLDQVGKAEPLQQFIKQLESRGR